MDRLNKTLLLEHASAQQICSDYINKLLLYVNKKSVFYQNSGSLMRGVMVKAARGRGAHECA